MVCEARCDHDVLSPLTSGGTIVGVRAAVTEAIQSSGLPQISRLNCVSDLKYTGREIERRRTELELLELLALVTLLEWKTDSSRKGRRCKGQNRPFTVEHTRQLESMHIPKASVQRSHPSEDSSAYCWLASSRAANALMQWHQYSLHSASTC